MKRKILNILSTIADYLEIAVSVLVVILIVIAFTVLLKDVGIFYTTSGAEFNAALGSIMNIVIGIEFLKMLTKHDIRSVVEVILFAISRKLLIDHASITEFLIGVFAISVLLVVRKFLFVQGLDDK